MEGFSKRDDSNLSSSDQGEDKTYTIHLLEYPEGYTKRELDEKTFRDMWQLLNGMDGQNEVRGSKYVTGEPSNEFKSEILDKKSPKERLKSYFERCVLATQKRKFTTCYIPPYPGMGDSACLLLLPKRPPAVIFDSKNKLQIKEIVFIPNSVRSYCFVPSISSYLSFTDRKNKQTKDNSAEVNSSTLSNNVTGTLEKAAQETDDSGTIDKEMKKIFETESRVEKESKYSEDIRGFYLTKNQMKKIFGKDNKPSKGFIEPGISIIYKTESTLDVETKKIFETESRVEKESKYSKDIRGFYLTKNQIEKIFEKDSKPSEAFVETNKAMIDFLLKRVIAIKNERGNSAYVFSFGKDKENPISVQWDSVVGDVRINQNIEEKFKKEIENSQRNHAISEGKVEVNNQKIILDIVGNDLFAVVNSSMLQTKQHELYEIIKEIFGKHKNTINKSIQQDLGVMISDNSRFTKNHFRSFCLIISEMVVLIKSEISYRTIRKEMKKSLEKGRKNLEKDVFHPWMYSSLEREMPGEIKQEVGNSGGSVDFEVQGVPVELKVYYDGKENTKEYENGSVISLLKRKKEVKQIVRYSSDTNLGIIVGYDFRFKGEIENRDSPITEMIDFKLEEKGKVLVCFISIPGNRDLPSAG